MESLFDLSLINSTLRMMAPLLLAGLGGAICSRVGVFNVGLDGLMLMGAFLGIAANAYTNNVWLAILIAIIGTTIFSALYGYMMIDLQANMIVTGIAMNFLSIGMTTFALRTIFDVQGAYYNNEMQGLPVWEIPVIDSIPLVGNLLSGQSPIVYLGIVCTILMYIFFKKSVAGSHFDAVGINPTAAKSQGIKVRRIQYLAVLISGILCALAGAQLSLGQVTMFSENMTAGRGFIALVATMLGQSNPIGVFLSSGLFGFTEAISIRLQGLNVPTNFTLMLPYVITILAMFIFKDKNQLSALKNSAGSSR
ncbi:simple sugar transport system permease protein [Gracilibacillus ureilyticus]|uniref:Simple sugar transport system permease protein n=1 Tax=Gracilibacillus ureilyticus TaxID=531814 RepID=A0A1H9P131_9BACI|nr:ABC transporter permease [Gracilibacillus ureilyticus]SER41303.1 simple sugar transport system permease protein [Gracilibacillus ureilyticus]